MGSTGSGTTGGANTCFHPCAGTADCPSDFTCVAAGGWDTGTTGSFCQPCYPPAVVCNGACKLPIDVQNCGVCGNACGPFQECVAGTCRCKASPGCGLGCACGPQQRLCGDACVDTSRDPANCGGCGAACLPGQTCAGGACAVPADAGSGPDLFQPVAIWATGAVPAFDYGGLAVADVTGDGQPDLLVLDSDLDGGQLTVFPGGDGGVGPKVTSPSGPGNGLVVAGLFDGGSGDVAAAFTGSRTVWLSPNVGAGGFGPPVRVDVACEPGVMAVAAADLTGDGLPELALTCGPPSASDETLAVLPNLGGGAFGAPVFSPLGESFANEDLPLLLRDLNGDGAPDLLALGHVALDVGAGAFGPPSQVTTGVGDWVAAAGDLNGDGHLDLVLHSLDAPGGGCPLHPLPVLLGLGDGTFSAGATYALPDFPLDVAVGDFNGDGHLDVAILLDEAVTRVPYLQVYRGDGSGGLATDARRYPLTAQAYGRMGIGDLNGDGRDDVAVRRPAISGLPAAVEVLLTR